jgi:molybdopterin converting factor small subunit
MYVSVQFYGAQRAVARTDKIKVPLFGGGRVIDIFHYLINQYPDLSLNEEGVMIAVNDTVTDMHQLLNAEDKITFLPHIGGG